MAHTTYIPFAPSNYSCLQTENDDLFYVKSYISESENIVLYKNIAEHNRVDKTDFLTEVGTLNGVFRDGTSITDVTVTIEYPGIIYFNYVYIKNLNRYYFINDIRVIRAHLYELDLSVDVLMTYKDAIRNLNAFVDRNENERDRYLIDKKRVIEQGYDIEIQEYNNGVFFDNKTKFDTLTDIMYVLNGYKIDVEVIKNE